MKVHLVNEIESEAGWGSHDSDQYLFPSGAKTQAAMCIAGIKANLHFNHYSQISVIILDFI